LSKTICCCCYIQSLIQCSGTYTLFVVVVVVVIYKTHLVQWYSYTICCSCCCYSVTH